MNKKTAIWIQTVQPLQSILCIWLFIFFSVVYVTNIEAEANHLLFEIWIFPFEIRSFWSTLGYGKRDRESEKKTKHWKSTLRANAISGFRMIIFRHTFNLCNAHELSWAGTNGSQIKTAQFFIHFISIIFFCPCWFQREWACAVYSQFFSVVHFIHLFQWFAFDFDSDNHGDK